MVVPSVLGRELFYQPSYVPNISLIRLMLIMQNPEYVAGIKMYVESFRPRYKPSGQH